MDVCVCVSDVLVKCVYTAYKARRCLLHTSTQSNTQSSQDVRHSSCLVLCGRASRLLSETISHMDAAPHSHITKVRRPVILILVLVLVLKDKNAVLVLVLEQKSLVMSLCSVLFKFQFTETACAWCKLACYLFIYLFLSLSVCVGSVCS